MNFFWAAVYSSYKVIGQNLPTGAIVTLRFGLAALCLLFAWPWLPGPAPRGRDLALTTDFRQVLGEAVYSHLGNKALDEVFPGYESQPGKFLKLLA